MSSPRLQDLLEAQFASQRVARLLDLGCGDGAATRRLLITGLQPQWVTGVDPEDSAFSPGVPPGESDGEATTPVASNFIRADAHSVVSEGFPDSALPDMALSGRALHHVRQFGRLLKNTTALLRMGAAARDTCSRLVVWEPVAAAGPFSELHRIKVDVDRELGVYHRRPFTRTVLERVLRYSVSAEDVRWDVLCEVQASREPYSESEYRSEVEYMHRYVGLVRDRKTTYARLKRRLSMLPPTPEQQPFGEPLLLAVATVCAHRS
ncbi:MAG: methyltransferase domain-containing protein [Spirochaetales bacterium]